MRRWLRSDGLTGLALPMVVWALHFLLIYVLMGLVCARDWSTRSIAGLPMPAWLLLGLAVGALLALALLALRAWRSLRDARIRVQDASAERARFIAGAMLALCLLAAIAVAWTTLPALLLPACGIT